MVIDAQLSGFILQVHRVVFELVFELVFTVAVAFVFMLAVAFVFMLTVVFVLAFVFVVVEYSLMPFMSMATDSTGRNWFGTKGT